MGALSCRALVFHIVQVRTTIIMRIGIVTQPLSHNYGGILQNYALQQVLKRLGHEPITIDYRPKVSLWRFLLSTLKSVVLFFLPGRRRRFAPWPKASERNRLTAPFIEAHIAMTDKVTGYSERLVHRYQLDGVITGSDQVWRPCYNVSTLYDCYLRFVKGKRLRVAYAASFGVDHWEYSLLQTARCKRLARQLDAVSVREQSGIALCASHLGIKAIETLDPTLLLSPQDYAALCTDVPKVEERLLAAYLLDMDDEKRRIVEHFAYQHQLVVRYVSADQNLSLRVEEWLALFRDARFVITDSFHGTVFSIIHHKDFISIMNRDRGASRFESLLSKFGLQGRLISCQDEMEKLSPIDWNHVNELKQAWQSISLNFLKESLCQK